MTENRKWNSPERLIIFGLLFALVFTVSGFEIASATIPSADGTGTFCYKVKNGSARVIDPSAATCKKTEHSLSLRSYDPLYALVSAGGVLGSNKHATAALHGGAGFYKVSFDQAVTTCALAVTSDNVASVSTNEATATHGPTIGGLASDVWVLIGGHDGTHVDTAFSLTVTC